MSGEKLIAMHISPASWGLPSGLETGDGQFVGPLGVTKDELEDRCRSNTYEWLLGQFKEDEGAFYGFYDPRSREASEPQTANLIAPWQLVAAFDRYQDEELLDKARRCIDWLDHNMVDLHPMSLVLGGVRDNLKPDQLWTKYTADYVLSNLGVYRRTGNEQYLARATQSGRFLLQAQRHGFSPMYDRYSESWVRRGWQSFGRVAGAMLAIWQDTRDDDWLGWTKEWAEFGCALQTPDGCFRLINDQYYSSDIAADEIRTLACLAAVTGENEFMESATRFADWHVANQLEKGAWWLAIDRFGVRVSDYVGPGDVSNLAIALLLMHNLTDDVRYLAAATQAIRYALSVQAVPGTDYPYAEDPRTAWGFWSWDPYYDYTMSPDQSTHHVRGILFYMDYYLSLDDKTRDRLIEKVGEVPTEETPA